MSGQYVDYAVSSNFCKDSPMHVCRVSHNNQTSGHSVEKMLHNKNLKLIERTI
jgi:hypothetical protein